MRSSGGLLALIATAAFAGYTLVYAAVANGGAFASTPWEGLRQDAYGAVAAGAAEAHHRSWVDSLIGSPGDRGLIGNAITHLITSPSGPEPTGPLKAWKHGAVKGA